MTKFVTFGETMVQYNAEYLGPYNPESHHLVGVAGAESNVAVNLAKITSHAIDVVWISQLGNDKQGAFVQQRLADKIKIDAPLVNGEKTGTSILNHYADDRHVNTYNRKDSAASKLGFSSIKPHLVTADLLHVTGITPALSTECKDTIFRSLEACQSMGVPVSIDVNYREQLWNPEECRTTITRMIPYATLFKLGLDEAETIWSLGCSAHEYAKQFHDISGGLVIVTQGESGAVLFDGENMLTESSINVTSIDPVGAGDAFVAGFIGSLLNAEHDIKSVKDISPIVRSKILRKALKIANICGALTCTKLGDTAAMPTMKDIKEFMTKPT